MDLSRDQRLRGRRVLLVGSETGESSRYGLWLDQLGALVSISTSHDGARLSKQLCGTRYDLVLFDLSNECTNTLASVLQLIQDVPGCSVAIVARHADGVFGRRVRRLGAHFIRDASDFESFSDALGQALETPLPCLRALTARAVQSWTLSPQLARILYYNLWSFSNQEIADMLNVTLHTVQDYQVLLRQKTGARGKDGYLRRILESTGVSPPVRDVVTRSLGPSEVS